MTKRNQNSITERAMLVSLNIQQWFGNKHDKKIAKEVADTHKSDVSMGRFVKKLVAKEALDKISRLTSAARLEHYHRTLPWQDGGTRILSSEGYFEYAKAMRQKEIEWNAAVAEFVSEYPQLVADARQRLNGLFNQADYPATNKIQRKFSFAFDVLPMPSAQDFRVELGDAETARVRADIEHSVNESIKAAMTDVWQRISGVVAHMKERLDAYSIDEEGTVSHPFRDSLVDNIRELLEILPSLNITQDANMTQVATRINKELCAHSADVLREDDTARKETAKAAEQILQSMEAYL